MRLFAIKHRFFVDMLPGFVLADMFSLLCAGGLMLCHHYCSMLFCDAAIWVSEC